MQGAPLTRGRFLSMRSHPTLTKKKNRVYKNIQEHLLLFCGVKNIFFVFTICSPRELGTGKKKQNEKPCANTDTMRWSRSSKATSSSPCLIEELFVLYVKKKKKNQFKNFSLFFSHTPPRSFLVQNQEGVSVITRR